MASSLRHRGPDQQAAWSGDGVALGATRLAVLDLLGGDQPRTDESGRIVAVLNGEIYNYRELRVELEARGHVLKGTGDSEVLPHLYEEFGDDFPVRMRGMFAFALYDGKHRRLLLGRDRLGIKPLYYTTQGPFAFASELRALRAAGLLTKELDPEALDAYLSWYSVPGSLYAGARALEPGHVLVREADGTQITRQWWSLERPTATGDIRRLLQDSVALHLLSDVPLGVFLSGGIDSTLLLALATQLRGEPLESFSVGFDAAGQALDESEEAAHQARRLGSLHHRVTVTGADVARDLPRLVQAMDQPTADGIQTWYVSRAASERVKVALSGLGGDELFGGYRTFHMLPRTEALAVRLPRPLHAALRTGLHLLPGGPRFLTPVRQVSRLVDAAPYGRAGAYLALRAAFSPAEKQWLLHDARPGVLERRILRDTPATDGLDPIVALELTQYMRHVLLRDADVMSMAHSLELRVPFLDHPLVEIAAYLPASLRSQKSGLIDAFRHLLDDRVLTHPKQGFSFPLGPWMHRELRPEVEALLDPGSLPAALRPRPVARLVRAFLKKHPAVTPLKIWTLIVLRRWLEVA